MSSYNLLLKSGTEVLTISSVFVPVTELGHAPLYAMAFLEYSSLLVLNQFVKLPSKFVEANGGMRSIENSFVTYSQ